MLVRSFEKISDKGPWAVLGLWWVLLMAFLTQQCVSVLQLNEAMFTNEIKDVHLHCKLCSCH